MADLSVTPVASGIKPVAATSLADMLNIARGAQAYQQSQQLNPLALQQAQEELTSKQLANQLAQGTLQPKIVQQENLTAQSEMKTDVDKLNKINAHANDVVQNIQDLLRKPDLSAQDIIERAKDINTKNGGDEQSLAKSLVGLPQYGSAADYKAWAAHALARTMASQAQLEKLYPSAGLVERGGAIVPTAQGNQLLTGQAPGTQVGAPIVRTLPPTTEQVAPSGAKTYIGQAEGQAQPVQAALDPYSANLMAGAAQGITQNMAEYEKGLSQRVVAANQIKQRGQELTESLEKFKAGAGTSTYVGLAQKLQAIGAPQSMVDAVAGGNVAEAQSVQKFLAGNVMAAVRSAAGGDPARVAEIDNFIKNNPTYDSDPRTLKKFIDFTTQQANRDILEQKALADARKAGTFNPATWQADLQSKFEKEGLIPKTQEEKAKNTNQPSGKTVVRTGKLNGRVVVQYSDGTVEYK